MRLFVMNHALAAEFRKLAAEPFLKARADQLRSLAGAVEEPAEGERWCEVDLFAAFPPEETVRPGPHMSRWAGVLNVMDLVQPVLVFLPIVITWLGLQRATTAYGEAITSGGAETARRPFLEMWQQGFDGRLSGIWRFDSVALATLMAIVLLITVTLLERLLRRREENRAELRAEELRIKLRAALTEAALTLGQVRLASPARFQAELTKSAIEISEVGSTLRRLQEQVVQSLEGSLESTRQGMQSLMEASADVQAAAWKLDEHLASVTAATADLTQTVDRTTYAIDRVGEKAESAMDQVGDRLGVLVADSTDRVRTAMEEATTRAGAAVRDTTRELDGHVGELTERVSELATVGNGISSALDGLHRAVADVTSMTQATMNQVGEQITGALNDTTSAFTRTFGDTGEEVRHALEGWAGAVGDHASRIEIASDASGRTVRLLEELRELPAALTEAIEEIPASIRDVTSVELDNLRSAVGQLPLAVSMTVAEISPVIRKATEAELIDLSQAIGRLQDAVDQVGEVIAASAVRDGRDLS
jgi:chromosome segregation ATPase